MQVFVTINKDEMMTNADANVRNSLTKEYVMKDSFEILVIVTANVINHAIKKIIDKLTEECSENINGNELLYNETLDIISSSGNNKISN